VFLFVLLFTLKFVSINYSQTVKLSRFLSILLSWKKKFLVKNMVFVCTLAFIAHVTALSQLTGASGSGSDLTSAGQVATDA
jgi:hypothetical protein